MKNLIIYKKTILCFVVFTFLFIGCTPKKIISSQSKINNKSKAFEIVLAKSDSINKYFEIKKDIIYSNKVFPPKDSKYDENLGLYSPNLVTEGKAINDAVRTSFNKERYSELVRLKETILMHLYIDDKNTIREVIIITRKNTELTNDELILIINNVKGNKLSAPPAYVNYKYNMFGQSFKFK